MQKFVSFPNLIPKLMYYKSKNQKCTGSVSEKRVNESGVNERETGNYGHRLTF
jgi:hypothetical protein